MRILQGTERLIHDRTEKRQRVDLQEQAHFENFVMGSDANRICESKSETKCEFRQKRMSSIAESCTEHSIIWGMFMATTLNAATFMGKNFSTIHKCCQEFMKSLTLKYRCSMSHSAISQRIRKKLLAWTKFCMGRILGHICH